jgi:ankyrin repeat protein
MSEFDLRAEFGESEVARIAGFAMIQDLLVDATESNLLETNVSLDELIAPDDSSLISDFCHMFYVAAKFRHQNIPTLVGILSFIVEKSQVPDARSRYAACLLPSFTRTNSRTAYRHRFIFECVQKGILRAECVIAEIECFQSSFPDLTDELDFLVSWYSPFVLRLSPSLAANPRVIRDAQLFETLVEYGYLSDTIEYCLKTDDVARFQDLIVANRYSLDRTIARSIFETGFLLENNPYYIHFAVYYGSVHCVKFMLLNNVDLTKKDSSMVFLPQFATAGGNGEIIRLLEQRKCYFNGTQQMAALFHRNSVFDWLHETKYHVTDYNDPYLGSILIQATVGNNLSIFLFLLEHSQFEEIVDFLCTDWTIYRSVLQAAAEYGHAALLRFLLGRPGIAVSSQNQERNTAAHFACYFGQFEVLQHLLDYPGIDLTLKNRRVSFVLTTSFFYRRRRIRLRKVWLLQRGGRTAQREVSRPSRRSCFLRDR